MTPEREKQIRWDLQNGFTRSAEIEAWKDEAMNRQVENVVIRPGYAGLVEKGGCFEFMGDLIASGSITVKLGGRLVVSGRIEAGRGIEAGNGIKAGKSIKAGRGIKAGWGIEAGNGIKAGRGIEVGNGIKAGESIKAGNGIKAGESIKAGNGIKAGLFIHCKRLIAHFAVFAGICTWRKIRPEDDEIICEDCQATIKHGTLRKPTGPKG